MNVLFVHYGDDWIAGSEVALLELLRALAGTDVKPFLWCNAAAMEKAARAIGIPVHRSDFAYYFDYSSPRFSPGAYMALVREACRLVTQTGTDLIHCNSGAPTQWMVPAGWLKRIPVLVNMHSPYLVRSRYVLGLYLADHIVAVTSPIVRPLLADGMDIDRISVIHNGFDGDLLLQGDATNLRTTLPIPPNAVIGAIAGSLIHRKGHDVLFDAIKIMDCTSRPFHLLVIGDGPKREEYEAAATGLPVHFLGYHTDLGAILRDCVDFLIMPSREEAFGRVIIEAAYAGKPAIASDVDGVPEAVLDGETGLLVPAESPPALASAIARLVEDETLRHRLGAAARERAKGEFSIDTCSAQMSAEYQATRERFRTDRFALFDPRRLKPYWTLVRHGRRHNR